VIVLNCNNRLVLAVRIIMLKPELMFPLSKKLALSLKNYFLDQVANNKEFSENHNRDMLMNVLHPS
jgi:hypothetical protein